MGKKKKKPRQKSKKTGGKHKKQRQANRATIQTLERKLREKGSLIRELDKTSTECIFFWKMGKMEFQDTINSYKLGHISQTQYIKYLNERISLAERVIIRLKATQRE